jgi:hypothetical protein
MQQHVVKIFYMGILCITLKERNIERFVQNRYSPMSPSTEWSWFFYGICHFYFICSQIIVIFKECMRKGRNSYCLFSHKLYFNASKLYQKRKKLPNVCHIYNVFTFRDTFSYISKLNNVIYWKCLAYTINIMYYLFLQLIFITKDLNCIRMNVICMAG